MKIGIPKEVKLGEGRMPLLVDEVRELVQQGHQITIGSGAGDALGIADIHWQLVGATVAADPAQVYDNELVVKVKEIQPSEFQLLQPGTCLFSFMHLLNQRERTEQLCNRGVTALGFEWLQTDERIFPILGGMSAVAGRVAISLASDLMRSHTGGRGLLLGSLDEIDSAGESVAGRNASSALVIGSGAFSRSAAFALAATGSRVTLMARNAETLGPLARDAAKRHPRRLIATVPFTEQELERQLPLMDLVVGSLFAPGVTNPTYITRQMVRSMQRSSVLIDASVHSGFFCETMRETSFTEPFFVDEGVVHSAIPNLPAAVPLTASRVLARTVLPYVQLIAVNGIDATIRECNPLLRAVMLDQGQIVSEALALSTGLPHAMLS